MGPECVGPRGGWSEAQLLGEGFAANLAVLRALQQRCGFTNPQAATVCGVSLRTYRRWLCEGNPTPAAVRLLAILAGFVPWVGWEDWEVHHGYLFPPGFSRHGLAPADFHALVFWRQLVSEYGRQNAALRVRLAELEVQLGRPAAAPGAGPERGPVVVPFSLDRLDQADPQPAASGRRSVG
ncbi:helix-turn-helix domain-containing protein [uncultured Thiodictyon sp.]|uniref:helix-turn-helix domain-containing protein n=1 Tax=uncultured Thiodictyon sp. TaxID=1846217 RepID=UPI0025D6D564|nr:helix-turn-helix domain-containing protein [uncultured Thiodictyon sp.]